MARRPRSEEEEGKCTDIDCFHTDCCLLVCCRPPQHKRLVKRLYPRGCNGTEPDLQPQDVNKLLHYSLRPNRLRRVGR